MDGSNCFIPLPMQSREVVFTSPTVALVTLYRVIGMLTNQEGHWEKSTCILMFIFFIYYALDSI
jgi:hypothetical protein